MSSKSVLLEAKNLTLSFGARQVLRGLSFKVHRGELFGLLGPNGCGKSTTFELMLGLLPPEEGEWFYEGKAIKPGARLLRRKVGVVFQKPSLDPNLSAVENLQLAGALHGMKAALIKQKLPALLDLADLTDRATELVKTLSGGMRRRLELARSLIHDPQLLVMDEPTTGLDAASFVRIWKKIQGIRAERGLSVLLTTHRPEEAAFCDQLALMQSGSVLACDTPANLQRAVSGDIITIEGDLEGVAELLSAQFGVEPKARDGAIEFACDAGHELIPRVVEALPAGSLRAIHLKRPSLGDVFLKLTGNTLDEDPS